MVDDTTVLERWNYGLANKGQRECRIEGSQLRATLPIGRDGEPQRLPGSQTRGSLLLSEGRYPRCTKQAGAFRDGYEEFGKLDAEVTGISSDSVKLHKGFAEKQSLPFLLLSDEGGKVRKLYGVPSTFGLLPGRVTYVIDAESVVRHVFASQIGVKKHVEEAREALGSLR